MAKQKEKRAVDMLITQPEIAVPFEVWRIIGAKTITFFGDQLCLQNEGDYARLDEARKAVEFYVEQLGGQVKWE